VKPVTWQSITVGRRLLCAHARTRVRENHSQHASRPGAWRRHLSAGLKTCVSGMSCQNQTLARTIVHTSMIAATRLTAAW
jgi:uncharacterized protein YaiL (DUF2058 family)